MQWAIAIAPGQSRPAHPLRCVFGLLFSKLVTARTSSVPQYCPRVLFTFPSQDPLPGDSTPLPSCLSCLRQQSSFGPVPAAHLFLTFTDANPPGWPSLQTHLVSSSAAPRERRRECWRTRTLTPGADLSVPWWAPGRGGCGKTLSRPLFAELEGWEPRPGPQDQMYPWLSCVMPTGLPPSPWTTCSRILLFQPACLCS